MAGLRSCFLLAEVALVVGASAWTLARFVTLRRRTEAYGLSDAIGAGAVGGMIGMAAGAALCVLRDGAAHAGGSWLGWASRILPFGGLALLEGAAVGVAVFFMLVRLTPGPGGQPSDDHDHAA